MKASEQRALREGVDARRVSGSTSCSNQTDGEVSEFAPLRLADAVTIAFPHGGMTVSGLRREIRRGRSRARQSQASSLRHSVTSKR
jgi:hypothetical protein